MKKRFRAAICSALAGLMLIPSMNVFAAETAEVGQIEQNIAAIEVELESYDTDVETELSKMIEEYQTLLDNSGENEEQIKSLISALEELLLEYQSYKSGISPYKFHAVYSPAVAAVISYFSANKYSLAAELLLHAQDNTVLNSNYSPVNGSRVKQSSVFRNIALGSKTSGSASFPNSGSVVHKDLYYAIHAFNYTKTSASSRTVKIRDRYDFAPGDYEGIADIAVNTMYLAQEAGVVVPYYVNITATL